MNGDIGERLARLENRMKTSFFEIERRLVNLETSSSAALGERIQELEDLLLLLQIENMKIKEKTAGEVDVTNPDLEQRLQMLESPRGLPGDIEERLNYIENKISSIKGKGDELLEDRLNELESRISATGRVYKEVSEIERRLSDIESKRTIPINIEERLDALERRRAVPINIEERLNDLEEKILLKGKVSEDIEERLDELNDRISKEVDRRLLEINKKVDSLGGTREEKIILKGIEDRLDELENNISLAVEESENISKTFERRLGLLERSKTGEVGLVNIERKLSQLEREVSLLGKDSKKIDFFTKELSEIDKRLNLLELRERPERGRVLSEVERILGGKNEEETR